MFSAFTIRVRPLSIEVSTPGSDGASNSPNDTYRLVGQIMPWKKSKKTKPFSISSLESETNKESLNSVIDLPYFGQPKKEYGACSITLILLTGAEDPDLVATCDFKIQDILETKDAFGKTFLRTLAMVDSNNVFAAKASVSVDLLCTGNFTLHLLNGNKISNASSSAEHDDQELFVRGYLNESPSKQHDSSLSTSENGENPEWTEERTKLKRKNTLSRIFTLYNMTTAIQSSSRNIAPGSPKGNNTLSFKFKNRYSNDIYKQPKLELHLYDKANSPRKLEKIALAEQKRVKEIKKKIADLRTTQKRQSAQRIVTKKKQRGVFTIFGGGQQRRQSSQFVEMDVEGFSEEEEKLLAKLDKATQHLTQPGHDEQEDRHVCYGSVDLRPYISQKPTFSSRLITLELKDKNGLGSGTLFCQLSFTNAVKAEVEVNPNLRNTVVLPPSMEKLLNSEVPTTIGGVISILKDVLLMIEVWIIDQGLIPDFISQTASDTGFSRLKMFFFVSLFTVNLAVGIWYGFGLYLALYLMSQCLGVVYPGYQTFKMLEDGKNDMSNETNDKQWLSYWVIYTLLYMFESALQVLNAGKNLGVGFVLGKLMFNYWLVMPKYQGASFLYFIIVGPWLRSYRSDIDRYMTVVGITGDNLAGQVAQAYENMQAPRDPYRGNSVASNQIRALSLASHGDTFETFILSGRDFKLGHMDRKKPMILKRSMNYKNVLLLACTTIGATQLIEDDLEEWLNLMLLNQESGTLEALNNNSIEGVRPFDTLVLQERTGPASRRNRILSG